MLFIMDKYVTQARTHAPANKPKSMILESVQASKDTFFFNVIADTFLTPLLSFF